MKQQIILIGSGGHAAVVLDMLQALPQYEVIGILDPTPTLPCLFDVPILGGDEQLPALLKQGVRHAFVAIGDNKIRKHLALHAMQLGFEFINVISQHAYVSAHTVLGTGICVMAGAVIQPLAQIGDHTIINTGATIDHHSVLAAFTHVAPGVTLSGQVKLGEGCFIGAGSTIIPNISVGDWVSAAAGCVITKNICAQKKVKGMPAMAY